MQKTNKLRILAIPAPTKTSEARKKVLQKQSVLGRLTAKQKMELFNLEIMSMFNCEC